MKSILIVFVVVIVFKVESFSTVNDNALQNAFLNLSHDLARRNRLVTVIVHNNATVPATLAITASIPRVVSSFKNMLKQTPLNSSAIVFLESVAALERFNDRTLLPTFTMQNQLLIYCQDGTVEKIAKITTSREAMTIVQYEYFVVEQEKSILLLTYVWYSPGKCNISQLVEVNKFEKSYRRWQHGNFWIDKFSNFHGCRINFLIQQGLPEFVQIEIDHENKAVTKCSGYSCSIVEDFSSALNYTYHINMYYRVTKMWPEIAHDLLIHVEAMYKNYSQYYNYDYVDTRPIYDLEVFFAVPPGEEYTGYEKLFLPYDEDTWMWIGITFASAFVTIFVLRFVPKKIANFVMGRDTTTPSLNLLRAFFGISQISCPGRNFARYLLMMFILFSLIIRTAYQGKMFEFLQKKMRKPTVESVAEMIEQNFTFYMPFAHKYGFEKSDFVKSATIIDRWTFPELFAAFERTYVPGSKTAVFYHKDFYEFVIRPRTNRTERPKLLKDRYMLDSRVYRIPRHHFLFEIFDRKLQQYIEADLIFYNSKTYKKMRYPNQIKEPFAVLTLGELEAGFVVCVIPLVLGVIVFGIEWMVTLKDLIVFQLIFKKYFDAKIFE